MMTPPTHRRRKPLNPSKQKYVIVADHPHEDGETVDWRRRMRLGAAVRLQTRLNTSPHNKNPRLTFDIAEVVPK